jgi:hypothetical protein
MGMHAGVMMSVCGGTNCLCKDRCRYAEANSAKYVKKKSNEESSGSMWVGIIQKIGSVCGYSTSVPARYECRWIQAKKQRTIAATELIGKRW